ncbi:hypothetical protein TNCV_2761791 [Trichonephila clavipes]|nr:hypothetical protein TNCV_2761791 [Trichonephila clavipes]
MGRDTLEVDLTRKGKSFKYLEDVCTCAIPHVMPIGQVLDGTSTLSEKNQISYSCESDSMEFSPSRIATSSE